MIFLQLGTTDPIIPECSPCPMTMEDNIASINVSSVSQSSPSVGYQHLEKVIHYISYFPDF